MTRNCCCLRGGVTTACQSTLLLALYLLLPRYLFNMGPAYMCGRGVETLRIDGYLTLGLLTYEILALFVMVKYPGL